MTQPIAPFLMFSGEHRGQAAAAIDFYLATFSNSRIVTIERYGPDQPGPEGTVQLATFVLNGVTFMASDSPIDHVFNFTPSISFFVQVEDEGEVDRLAGRLGDAGAQLMPPDDYGFSRRFAWVADKFGVTWQVNCP